MDIIKEKKAESSLMIIFCHIVGDILLVLSTLLMKLGNDAYLKGSDPAPAPDGCILAVYYSATPESAKTRVTNSFTFSGNARMVIASTSLSMGIDFPHVRYVIHFGPGRTLTDHLQQAGRAGRDSQNAYNIVTYMGKHLRQCEVAAATFFIHQVFDAMDFLIGIIEAIVENSYKIFTITDFMAHSFVSSLQLAVTVLEVFAEVFEDITGTYVQFTNGEFNNGQYNNGLFRAILRASIRQL